MDIIVHRAEQAVLGALLAAPSARPPSDIAPGDFADRRHRAIFAAITGAGPQPGGLLNRLRAWLAALPWRQQVRDLHAYLDELPAACPDPANLDRYAAMVHQASQQRGTAAQAEQGGVPDIGRLAGAVAWLERETQNAAAQRGRLHPGSSTAGTLPRDIAVARGGLRAAAHEAARSQETPVNPARPAAATSAADNSQIGRIPAIPTRPEQRAMHAEDLQELVLADLMRHPGDAKQILGWLPAEVFTPGPHRAMYDLIRQLTADGEPADPLIIAWHARNQPADDAAGSGPSEVRVNPGEILRIGAIRTAPGTAVILGRALLADHFYTRRFGAGWERLARFPGFPPGREPIPDAQPAAEPQVTPTPEPTPAPGPAPVTQPAPATRPRPAPELSRPGEPAASGPVPHH
jgi:DnaB-like helicase N terminal domain